MVKNPRTAAGARGLPAVKKEPAGNAERLHPLNEPAPVAVEANSRGEPKAVLWKGVFKPVVAIHDTWRIDDEWWRDEIARRYFVAELEGGRRVTLYRDLVARDAWFAQTYEGPRASGSGRRQSQSA